MHLRKYCLPLTTLVVMALAAKTVCALGFELGESKEQLKLKYTVAAQTQEAGGVSLTLTLEDEGRVAPLTAVNLMVPRASGDGFYDLVVPLDRRKVNGKETVTMQLTKDLAQRGSVNLQTSTLDGKTLGLTWYYHSIPLAKYLKAEVEKKD